MIHGGAMPITDFDDSTFVAFIDISGFKQLMNDSRKAWHAIDRFYQYGYETLQRYPDVIQGIFISDCGILFSRDTTNQSSSLVSLLEAIKSINKQMLQHNFMLTTSIAFGEFRYQERIEFDGIEKNPVYGNAYVSAFLDNENGKPKIQPGQCRIIKENLPITVREKLDGSSNNELLLRTVKRSKSHYYFYWMVHDEDEIQEFEKDYHDSYNLKYSGMLSALKRNRNN